MEKDDSGVLSNETKEQNTERKKDDMTQLTVRVAGDVRGNDEEITVHDPTNKDIHHNISTENLQSQGHHSALHDSTDDLNIDELDVSSTTDDNFVSRSCKEKCSVDILLTTLTVLVTTAGLFFHLYGFISPYWRHNQISGAHFGLWKYCNKTCYRINSYNNWYFGVQACAVMGVCWSIVSGILSVHGLVRGNGKTYVLSLFFYFWACACVLAAANIFGFKYIKGYALSSSYSWYVTGAILQMTAVIISIRVVGSESTLRLVTCGAIGRRKRTPPDHHSEGDTDALVDSEA